MFERFTERSRKVLALATQEARACNHEYLGTEHILLGMLKEGSGVGSVVLRYLDFDYKKAKSKIKKLVKEGSDVVTMGVLPRTPRTRNVIEEALQYAKKLNHQYVGTEHLLYGLIKEEGGIAFQVFEGAGLTGDKIVRELEDLLQIDPKIRETQSTVESISYWKIPKSKMDLVGFLKNSGYEIPQTEDNDSDAYIARRDPSRELKMELGRINLTNPNNPIITIRYYLHNKTQISEALDLKDILDNNNVKYSEDPSSAEVLEKLKGPLGDTFSIINRLEKRV